MEKKHLKRRMAHFFSSLALSINLLLIVSGLIATFAESQNGSTPLFPAVIVFGDSIVDAGNNNVLKTIIKANFPPYGNDFLAQQPTGRFCNGKIPSDFVASKIGVKEYLPAYLGTELGPEDLLTGVTFASAGSGYDPMTAKLASVLSMSDQLELFREYKEKLRVISGEERAAKIVAESLYVVCTGSDDVANTYSSTPFRKAEYDIPSYAHLLVDSALSFLEELVQSGARKIGIIGIPPIGCVPSQRTLEGGILRSCASDENQLAKLFNSKLSVKLESLTSKHQEAILVYIDVYSALLDIFQNPTNYGFVSSTKGCCGTGVLEVSVLCNSLSSSVCIDASKYVFWDSYHPTERAYEILVDWVIENYINMLL